MVTKKGWTLQPGKFPVSSTSLFRLVVVAPDGTKKIAMGTFHNHDGFMELEYEVGGVTDASFHFSGVRNFALTEETGDSNAEG